MKPFLRCVLLVFGLLPASPGTPRLAEASETSVGAEVKDGAGSNAASTYLTAADVGSPVRDAMLAVVRQQPMRARWFGRSGPLMFGLAVKHLPAGSIRQRAVLSMLELTQMVAVQELLKGKSLLDRYVAYGLTDASTLKRAIMEAAGKLDVKGSASVVRQGAATEGDYAVAFVIAEEQRLLVQLLQETELAKVQVAYRDVMHRQVKDFMRRAAWKEALVLWNHLHTRKLVSPQLYLDAARCFKELGQKEDTIRVLYEAIDTFGQQASVAFFEDAGDIALNIEGVPAHDLAKKAYQAASDRLKTISDLPGATKASK